MLLQRIFCVIFSLHKPHPSVDLNSLEARERELCSCLCLPMGELHVPSSHKALLSLASSPRYSTLRHHVQRQCCPERGHHSVREQPPRGQHEGSSASASARHSSGAQACHSGLSSAGQGWLQLHSRMGAVWGESQWSPCRQSLLQCSHCTALC